MLLAKKLLKKRVMRENLTNRCEIIIWVRNRQKC